MVLYDYALITSLCLVNLGKNTCGTPHVFYLRLRNIGITAKLSKCEWSATSLQYLGHVVGKGMVSVPNAKVEALKNYKMPITKTDLKSISRYYGILPQVCVQILLRRHVLSLMQLKSLPLKKMVWNYAMLSAFTVLRNELCSVSVSHIPTE